MPRRILCALLVAVVSTAGVAHADYEADLEAEIEAIVDLARADVSDDVIVKHVRASGFVFALTADDILYLRGRGVSDAVLEAMLDTALEDGDREPRRRSRDSDDDYGDRDVELTLSAGYFSPWYSYPYAWGFYYDPFPACYSFYYYPFRFAYSWGYYGHCRSYYYRTWCARYRWWDDPRWYNEGRRHAATRVRVPREVGVAWHAGTGLHADRNDRRGRSVGAPLDSRRRESTVGGRLDRDRDRVRMRPPRARRDAAAAPRSGHAADAPRPRRSGAPALAPRSRGNAPAVEPRRRDTQSAPSPRGRRDTQSAPSPRSGRDAAPAPAPRSGREAAPAPAPRSSGATMAPRSGGPAAAPRGAAPAPNAGASMPPRRDVGTRGRLGS
jgi:hypothetical protein